MSRIIQHILVLVRNARRPILWMVRGVTSFWLQFCLIVGLAYQPLKWVLTAVLMTGLLALGGDFLGRYILGESFGINTKLAEVIKDVGVSYRLPIASIVGFAVVLSIGASIGHSHRQRQLRLLTAFKLWKPAQDLNLADLGFQAMQPRNDEPEQVRSAVRPFYGTYFPRVALEEPDLINEDAASSREYSEEDLEILIRNNGGFLLVGQQWSGKTLTLLNVLWRLNGYTIVMPDGSRPVPEDQLFAHLKGKKILILLDNLATYAKVNYDLGLFARRVSNATGGRYGVAGTCREGGDFTAVLASSGNHVTYFFENTLVKLRLSLMTHSQRRRLASSVGWELNQQDLAQYPHPGNITMRDWTRQMLERFKLLPEQTKDLLRAMKLLDAGGIPITLPRLQGIFAPVFRREVALGALEDVLVELWNQLFLVEQPSGQNIEPHFGYLTYAVSFNEELQAKDRDWDNLAQALEQMLDADALGFLGMGHAQRRDLLRSLGAFDGVLRLSPDNAQAHYHRAYTLARLGRLTDALAGNSKALELQPEFAEAFNNRGYILARLGRLSDALNAIQSALEFRLDYEDAHTNRAIVLARLGRFDEAFEEFNTSLGISPENYYAYLNLGITLSRQNAFEEAFAAYDQALQHRPDYPEAHLNRGITLARMGNFDEAFADFNRALELRSDYPEVHLHMGMTLAGKDRFEEAIDAFSSALSLRPDYLEVYLRRGITLSRMSHFDEALADFAHALELRPDYPEVHLRRGMTLARMSDFDAAFADFNRTLELQPDYPEAHLNRAMTLARMGNSNEALDDFNRTLELRPDYPEAHLRRGITLAADENFDKALADFNRALELRPDYPEAHYQIGRAFAIQNRYDLALPSFDCAIQLRPDFALAHCDRSAALANLKRPEEAIQAVDIALAISPEFAEGHYTRGYVLTTIKGWDQDRLERALHEYEEAARIRPDFAEAHRECGFILSQLGRDEEALAAQERALEIHPEYADALYGKARTLCFLTRRYRQRFDRNETLIEVMDLLERAVAIDNRIIRRITRERNAFRELGMDPNIGPRLRRLIWGDLDDRGHSINTQPPSPSI